MKNFFALVVVGIVVSHSAFGVSSALCFAICKKINASKKGMHCQLDVTNDGVNLYLDLPKWNMDDPDADILSQSLAESYFAAARGGLVHMEIQAPEQKGIMSCYTNNRSSTGYSCEGIDRKNSSRKAKP